MVSRLSDILRKHQQTVQAQMCERLSELEREREWESDGGKPPSWMTLLDTLLDYWEQSDEETLRHWAMQRARESVDVGASSSEMLHILHHAALVIRSYLATRFWRQGPLLQGLDDLEQSMHLLRCQYLEAYETLSRAQQQRFQEYIADVVIAGVPEETLKRMVTAVQALSQARYVALHVAVATSAVSSFFAKKGADAEIVMYDEPPEWCQALAAQLSDDVRPLPGPITGQGVPDGECLGVALRSESGVMGHLFTVHEKDAPHYRNPIESLAVYAGAAIHTSVIYADMRAEVHRLHTVTNQTALELQELRPVLRDTQQRLENLIQHLPEGVLMLDTDFRIVMANPLGRDYLTVLSDTGVGERLVTLGIYPIEFLLLTPDEGHHHEVESQDRAFEVEVKALQSGAQARGWLLVFNEVTEKRQARQHMQQKEHLANVGQGVAGMAHDFNNLLSGTISLARSLEVLEGMPPVARDRLARIVELGKHGSNLVRQMIDVTPAPTNTSQPLNLNAFLSETCEMLKHVIPNQVYFFLGGDAGAQNLVGGGLA